MADPRQAPEAHTTSQDDAPDQAQTLADEALRRTSSFENGETEKVGHGDEFGSSAPDLVDTMNQMVTSGRIDMGAFAGERSDDDEAGTYGEAADEDEEFPHGAE